jgi:peptidyl-prolyl cis-trans isomerase D
VIVRVAKITPGETKTLEDVREQLRRDLLTQKAGSRISEIVNKFEDERAADKPFAQAARESGLRVERVVIDGKGLAPDGTKPNIPASAVFIQQITTTEGGSESDIFSDQQTGTAYAINVIGVRPPALKPLASVREQVRTALLAERRGKMLLARVQALAAEAKTSGDLSPVSRALGRAPATSTALTRGKPNAVFSADALGKLFGAPSGTVIHGRAGNGGGYVIARAIKVTHPQPAPQALGALRGQVSSQVASDIGDTVAVAARKEAGVEIHPQALESALGQQ